MFELMALDPPMDGQSPAPVGRFIPQMDEILHHLGNHGKPLSVGIYRGIIIPGFLSGCRISSIRSRFIPRMAGKRLFVSVAAPGLVNHGMQSK